LTAITGLLHGYDIGPVVIMGNAGFYTFSVAPFG
jgi:hypothetical protein